MWVSLVIIILFILLLFIPIPFTFQVIYQNSNVSLYVYKKFIFSFKEYKEKSDIKKKKIKREIRHDFNLIDFKTLILVLYKNPFKPKLNLSLSLNYSLDDASLTAITYGFINQFLGIAYSFINTLFNISSLDYRILPEFKDTFELFLDIKGIIYINIVKLIYILFLYLYKNLIRIREVHYG